MLVPARQAEHRASPLGVSVIAVSYDIALWPFGPLALWPFGPLALWPFHPFAI